MDTISKITPALIKAIKTMSDPVKACSNLFYKSKYADLNAVREACFHSLHENGIIVLQPTRDINGDQFVETILLHESGEMISALTRVKCLKENDPQSMGSGISYARRYGLQSILCLGAEDDDGNAASNVRTSYANDEEDLNLENPGDFIIPFGIHDGKKLSNMNDKELKNYLFYWAEEEKKGKKLSGKVVDVIVAIRRYLSAKGERL